MRLRHLTNSLQLFAEEGLQEGPGGPGEPAQVRLLRGHVQPHLPQRRLGPLEPQDPLRQRADLHLLRPFLYRRQPLQGENIIYHLSRAVSGFVQTF